MSYIPKIKNNRLGADAVTSDKIMDGEVASADLALDAVTGAQLADDAVGAEHIASGAVGTDELASGAVTNDKLGADAVDSAKLADDAVGSEHIQMGAVGSDELAADAVGETEIADGAVTNGKLGADAVDSTKLADDAVGAEHLQDGSVGSMALAADAVDGSKIADDSIDSEHLAAGAIDEEHLADSAVTSAKIADGTILDADINPAAGIALSKLDTDPLARANHTGTQLADTISDFDSSVQESRLDQMAAPTSNVSMNGVKITNVLTPDSNGDAANKAYVDGVGQTVLNALTEAGRGLDVKISVRVASQGNVDLAAPGASIDGVSLNGPAGAFPGDRVLIKGQTAGAENGIYYFRGAASPMIRAVDADSNADVTAGMFTFVEEGSNADQGWVLTTDNPITLGTTPLVFSQFSNAVIVDDLDSLTDVDTSGAVAGSMLFYDGSGWVPTGGDIKANGAVLEADSLRLKAVASYSANQTLDPETDHVALVDTNGGAVTITLPASPEEGHVFQIKDAGGDAEANAITIAGNGNNIDGAGSFTMDVNYQNVTLLHSGGEWYVL